jgi:FAD:protein FMN transferase
MASQFVFDAIGTHWVVDIFDEVSLEKEKILLQKISERIEFFDKTYSRFRSDSLITEISKNAGRYLLPEDSTKLFSVYRKMYDLTNGLVTPFIGQVLVDAGYDAKYSLTQQRELSKPLSWDDAIKYNELYLDVMVPTILDFGAGGKGYLVDLVAEVLEENGVRSYCVDAGGDMVYKNVKDESIVVGLEHPEDITKVIGTIKLLNKSLCGSAGNRRTWGNFHHIINPETLSSPKEVLAVWVLSSSTFVADILTTGLFFVSPEIFKEHYDFEYFILKSDYSFEKSKGFEVELF